ncbi:hypothetical protein TcWFU_009436 [Taenia crassiceps]|uniref:Uncharacterized protein n=1 Tax=Taenia crassiceps TaxID=6207 RepID=A0ABR4Q471_9CEST
MEPNSAASYIPSGAPRPFSPHSSSSSSSSTSSSSSSSSPSTALFSPYWRCCSDALHQHRHHPSPYPSHCPPPNHPRHRLSHAPPPSAMLLAHNSL